MNPEGVLIFCTRLLAGYVLLAPPIDAEDKEVAKRKSNEDDRHDSKDGHNK